MLFVGQEPGANEDREGVPFIGRAGQKLRTTAVKAGLNHFTWAIQNTVRCGDWESSAKEIKLCRPFLLRDMEHAQPRVVVMLGAVALKGVLRLSNLTMRRGTAIYEGDRAYLPTWHPAAVLREPGRQQAFENDLVQVRKLLAGEQDVEFMAQLEERYRVCRTLDEVEETITAVLQAPLVAYDTEFTHLNWLHPDLKCLGVSFSVAPGHGVFIPYEHPEAGWTEQELGQVRDLVALVLRRKKLVVHNAEPDIAIAWRCFGVGPTEIDVFYDTMTGSQAIRGDQAAHDLKTLAYTETTIGGYEREVEGYKKIHDIKSYAEIPLAKLANPYACGDADATIQIAYKDLPRLKATGQLDVYRTIMKPAYLLNMEMRKNGLLIDWDQWAWREAAFKERLAKLYEKALSDSQVREFASVLEANGVGFLLSSKQQMRQLLFTVLRLRPSGRKTKKTKEHSLDAEALKLMYLQSQHPFLELLLEVAKITTYYGYLKSYAENMAEDGYLHANWHNFTATYRRGTSPNLQNWPGADPDYKGDRSKELYNLRMLARAEPGHGFVGFDYRQLEYRLAACYANDDRMIAGCNSTEGPHVRVQKIFDVTKKLAKIINFLYIYAGSPKKLRAEMYNKAGVVLSWERAEEIILGMDEEYDDLHAYIPTVHRAIKLEGRVVNAIGQVRWLPQIYSSDPELRERALREGWNFQCQSLGHAFLQSAMHQLYLLIVARGLPWKVLLDLHDGFVMQVPLEDIEVAAKVGKRLMERAPEALLPASWRKVSFEAEVSTGTHLGDMKEIAV